jgi:hypothetical protein
LVTADAALKLPCTPAASAASAGANGTCTTEGCVRWSQLRWLEWRGTVKAVPDNCSAYKPNGQRCGLLPLSGSVPGSASVENSLPKPGM